MPGGNCAWVAGARVASHTVSATAPCSPHAPFSCRPGPWPIGASGSWGFLHTIGGQFLFVSGLDHSQGPPRLTLG